MDYVTQWELLCLAFLFVLSWTLTDIYHKWRSKQKDERDRIAEEAAKERKEEFDKIFDNMHTTFDSIDRSFENISKNLKAIIKMLKEKDKKNGKR